jgi:hypothetical protein
MSKLMVESLEDFKEKAEGASFEICKHIYPAIKRGIEKETKTVKVFDLIIKGDPMNEYSFTLVKGQWRKALTTCLESYSNEELYEDCIVIQKLLATLPE